MADEGRKLAEDTRQADEETLIRRIREGEHALFYELIRPYERRIYATAFAILRNEADAEDAAQEAVLKAFKHIRQFRSEAKFSTWLTQITLNEARMRKRKQHLHIMEAIVDQQDDDGNYAPRDFADWREIPSEALESARLRAALRKGLEALGPKYRQVLVLRDIERLSIADTAVLMGITEATVKTRLLRARLMMRDALAPGFDGAWRKGREYEKVRPY